MEMFGLKFGPNLVGEFSDTNEPRVIFAQTKKNENGDINYEGPIWLFHPEFSNKEIRLMYAYTIDTSNPPSSSSYCISSNWS